MNHNNIISNFKSKLPEKVFFHYFPKSIYGSNPFDCLLIWNQEVHCIEFKTQYDHLKPHQHLGLQKAIDNGAKSWIIRGAFKKKGQLIRNFIQLETIEEKIILAGKPIEIINYLKNINR